MGAGRKTFSYDCDTVATQDLQFEIKQRNLGRDLGGVIFMCNNVTIRECKANLIFGLPSSHWCYVQHIRQGMPIFLYNFADKTMHGIYTATDAGAWEINPHGWTPDGAGQTKYPAQVQVQIHLDCPPLADRQFRPILAANYFRERGQEKFKQELDKQQAADLCGLFRKERQRQWGDKGVNVAGTSAVARPLTSTAPTPAAATTTAVARAPAAAAAPSSSFAQAALKRPAPNGSALTTESNKSTRQSQGASTSQPTAPQAPQPPQASAGQSSGANMAGVDLLSNEITVLKGTLGPVIARFRASPIPEDGTVANNLSSHISRLDDALMACQKERSKLMGALSEAQDALRKQKSAPALAAPGQALPGTKVHEVVALGGLSGTDYILGTDIYSPATRSWRPGPQLPSRRGYCGVAAIGRHVYMIGGGAGAHQWLKEAMRLDITTGEWTPIASLRESRGSMACVELGGKIYAAGGGQTNQYTNAVEIYDPATDSWSQGPALHTARFSTAAAVLDGAIYCSGGFDGKSYLRSAERLDPREGRWHALPDMVAARGALAAAQAHGGVYAIGGFDGVTEHVARPQERGFLKVVERFDPRIGKWATVAEVAACRAYGSAFSLEGTLYAVGGMRGLDANNDFEMYNAVSDSWEIVPGAAPQPRSMGAAVVVTL